MLRATALLCLASCVAACSDDSHRARPDGCTGASCGGGSATTLFAGDITELTPVFVDDTSVYFESGPTTSSSARTIESVPKAGGDATVLLPTDPGNVGTYAYDGFTLAGGSIYACQHSSAAKELVSIPVAGGAAATSLATLPAGVQYCFHIAVSSDAVYVALNTLSTTDPVVLVVPLGGGALTQLDVGDNGTDLVTDGTSAYYVGGANTTSCPGINTTLRSVSLSAQTPVELGCEVGERFGNAMIAGGTVAATGYLSRELDLLTLSPFNTTRHISENSIWTTATDGTDVYWSRWYEDGSGAIPQQDGRIRKVPATGSAAPVDVLTGAYRPYGLALDASYVYFVEESMMPTAGGPAHMIERVAR
jgi:hypothetical protein